MQLGKCYQTVWIAMVQGFGLFPESVSFSAIGILLVSYFRISTWKRCKKKAIYDCVYVSSYMHV